MKTVEAYAHLWGGGKILKVKNVIKGLKAKYDLQEIHIIDETKVIYSGPLSGWNNTDVDMIVYKHRVENMEVLQKLLFNHKKAFIFVGNPLINQN